MAFVPCPQITNCYWVSFIHQGIFYICNDSRFSLEMIADPNFHHTNPRAFQKLQSTFIRGQEMNPNFYREIYIKPLSGKQWIHRKCQYDAKGEKFPHFVMAPIVTSETYDEWIPKENIPEQVNVVISEI